MPFAALNNSFPEVSRPIGRWLVSFRPAQKKKIRPRPVRDDRNLRSSLAGRIAFQNLTSH